MGAPFGFGGLLGGGPVPDVQMPDGLPVAGGKGSPLVDAYLALQGQRIKDAVTAPRDAYTGDLQVLGADGHPTSEAMDRANGMAGLAMTGSLPFGAPKGALRMFGGGAEHADDPLAALSAALGDFKPNSLNDKPFTFVDPKAKQWDLYHGTNAAQDFDRFRVDLPRVERDTKGAPGEAGALFLSPAAAEAEHYAGDIASRSADGYGFRGGPAGPRVIRATVDPGKTDLIDIPRLYETDPSFVERARQAYFADSGGDTPITRQVFDTHHAQVMDDIRATRETEGMARAMGFDPLPPKVKYGYGATSAAVDLAKERGLDTAVIRGLNESNGGDQVIALTPGRVRSYYDPDHVLFSGGPAGSLAGLPALATSSDPKGSPVSAGLSPFGFGPMSDEIAQRLRLGQPLGVATGFPQAPKIAWPSQAQPAPQSAPVGAAPPTPQRPMPVAPPEEEADKPAPNAVPAQGQAPLSLAPPATPPAPSGAATTPDAGSTGGGFLSRLGDPRVANTLLGLSQGLLSVKGFGPAIGAGIGAATKLNKDQAVTDLAQAEYGLKTRKLTQEQGALTGNAAILKKAYPTLSDQEALAQGSNGSAVMEALKILRDPNHGRENDPAVIRARAQAQAEGTAAGGKDDVQLVTRPDGSVVAVNKSQIGEAGGNPTVTPVMAGTSKLAAEADERRQLVVAQGKDPSDPRYADYIVSGSLPKETQQLLTAADKKAVMDGEDTILAHKNTITQLNRALDLSKKAYDGAGAGARSLVVSNIPEMLGGHTPESLATREFSNVVTGQALDNLKATFGGAPTEGERAILLQVQGSADQPQALREQILKNAMAKVQQKLDFEQQRVDQLRGGTYYKQGGGAAASAGEAPAPGAATTGAKRMRYDPKTGGFN